MTEVVRREIVVQAPLEKAFTVFTERFGDFKPPEHNLLGSPIAETVFQPRNWGAPLFPPRAGRGGGAALGSGPRLRTTRARGVQLGHQSAVADRERSGQRERGRGPVHPRDQPTHAG